MRVKFMQQQEDKGIMLKYAFGQIYEVAIPKSYGYDKEKLYYVDFWVNLRNIYIDYMRKIRGWGTNKPLYVYYCTEAYKYIADNKIDISKLIDIAKPSVEVRKILEDIKILGGKEVVE